MVKEKKVVGEEEKIISEGKVYAMISYLWILCFVTLLAGKGNKFALFHAKQGLVLFLSWLFLLVIGILPIIGHIIAFAGMVIVMALSILGIIHALRGEYWIMPLLGGKAEDINIS